jgi:hypothetical protein
VNVSVIVPRAGDCPYRARAWAWLSGQFDGLEVVEGHGNANRWCKAEAVADGLSRASGELLVIHDADVYSEHLNEAIDRVRDGAPWASPHRIVRRLTEAGTAAFLDGACDPQVQERHAAKLGGGIVVLPSETYENVPLDPRFVGWGQEDESWSIALLALVGSPFIGRHELTHLYHPPQERKTRVIGSRESKELLRRYRHAKRTGSMRQLLDEVADGIRVQAGPPRQG